MPNNGYEIFPTCRSQMFINGVAQESPLNNGLTSYFRWNNVNYPELTVTQFQNLPETERVARETAFKSFTENYLRTYYGNRYPGAEFTFRYMNQARRPNTSACPIGGGGPEWKELSTAMYEPHVNACGVVYGGVARIIGGRRAAPTAGYQLNYQETYNFATGVWGFGQPLNGSRSESCCVIIGSTLYLLGGMTDGNVTTNKVEYSTVPTGTWSTGVSLTSARYGCKATVTGGGILIVGGILSNGTELQTVEWFSTATNTWTTKYNYPAKTSFQGIITDSTDLVYVYGGLSSGDYTRSYALSSNIWQVRASIPLHGKNSRYAFGFCADSAQGRAYAIGGTAINGTVFNNTDYFGSGSTVWTAEENLPLATWGNVALSYNNKIYSFGGIANGSPSNKGYVLE